MQKLIEFIIGLVAAIAATALEHFVVDVNSPRQTYGEVRRIADCPEPATSVAVKAPSRSC